MREIDKRALGRRIREVRREAGLRQWELAGLLGTTQSAIHKYEHGVVPEPRRLLEIARVGRTSIEWLLTGRHGEEGGTIRERPSDASLRTAEEIRLLASEDRERVERAVRLLRDASRTLGADLAEPLSDTLRVLEAARKLHRAVARRILEETADQLGEPMHGRDPEGTA